MLRLSSKKQIRRIGRALAARHPGIDPRVLHTNEVSRLIQSLTSTKLSMLKCETTHLIQIREHWIREHDRDSVEPKPTTPKHRDLSPSDIASVFDANNDLKERKR